MNKKILLGSSLGAVVILILVSFTGVVGYQTTKSSTIAKASPLFNTRINRAIDNEIEDMNCNYVGKNRRSLIVLASPDRRITLIREFVDKISMMNDKIFTGLLIRILNLINNNDKIRNENKIEIIITLQYLKNNPDETMEYLKDIKNEVENRKIFELQGYTLSGEWAPGCIIVFIFDFLFYILGSLFIIISALQDCLQSVFTNCEDCPCFRVNE